MGRLDPRASCRGLLRVSPALASRASRAVSAKFASTPHTNPSGRNLPRRVGDEPVALLGHGPPVHCRCRGSDGRIARVVIVSPRRAGRRRTRLSARFCFRLSARWSVRLQASSSNKISTVAVQPSLRELRNTLPSPAMESPEVQVCVAQFRRVSPRRAARSCCAAHARVQSRPTPEAVSLHPLGAAVRGDGYEQSCTYRPRY